MLISLRFTDQKTENEDAVPSRISPGVLEDSVLLWFNLADLV